MKIITLLYILVTFLGADTVRDMLGREVTFHASERLVALGPGALRLVVYMGLEPRLTGVERIERQPAPHAPYRQKLNIAALPVVGEGGAGKLPDFEALLKAKPDLILTSFYSREQIAMIEAKTGIAVVALSYGDSYGGRGGVGKLEGVKASLKLLGTITKTQQRATILTDFMDTQAELLGALGLKGRQAYIAGLGYKGAQGITSTEPDYPPFEMLGIRNAVVSEGRGHRFIKEETLAKALPEYLFIDPMGSGIIAQERQKRAWLFELLEKKGTFHTLLASNYYNANIENLFVNAWMIAAAMGENVDAAEQSRNIYRLFLGEGHAAVSAP